MAKQTDTVQDVSQLPQWTAHVAVDGGGRDPLGLSRVGGILLEYLSPAIVLNTDRARYYALYCWILWHIQQTDSAEDVEGFTREFQKREAAVALATLLADEGASPVGVRQVRPRLERGRETGWFDTQFRVLPANRLGGFGQYYGGSLYALGLTRRPEDGVDRVSAGIATAIALAVQESIAATPYIKGEQFLEAKVDVKTLTKSAERLSIDGLSSAFAADERALLVDLFFGFEQPSNFEQSIRMRRTLALILEIVASYEIAAIPIGADNLDDQLLYGPAYFGHMVRPEGSPKALKLTQSAREHADSWRQFCLHEYLTQAIEGVFSAVLTLADSEPRGVAQADVVNRLVGPTFRRHLRNKVGQMCPTPKDLLKAAGIIVVPDEYFCRRARTARRPSGELSEAFAWDSKRTPEETAAVCCLALSVLYGKWRCGMTDDPYAAVAEKAGPELCAPAFLSRMDSWLKPGYSWENAMSEFLSLLIEQHDRVMYGKGRLESCWVRMDDRRVVCDQPYEPYFRGSRQKQAVSIMVDLGLVRWKSKGEQLVCTAAGRKVLQRVQKLDAS